jgi:hypothetical protein
MDKTTLQQLGALEAASGMVISLIILVCLAVTFIWNIQRDRENKVDVKDLICSDGRINEAKFMRFTAFVVSTWGFVYLIVDQRFSEWYFAGYMAAWAGNALLNKWLTIKQGTSNGIAVPPPPPRSNI